jgi:SAM-dependent methyltransferase
VAPVALAPAASRNTAPILGVLVHELHDRRSVLEIGSGTGQHAVAAAAALPSVTWQPTELADRIPAIRAMIDAANAANVLEPLEIDVRAANVPGRYEAVFTANTLHIVSEAAVRDLIRLAGRSLESGGVFLGYGPFRRGGAFSTPSNAAFDASLRAGDGDMGIRDLEAIDVHAAGVGLERRRVYAMPANNLLVAWQKMAAG